MKTLWTITLLFLISFITYGQGDSSRIHFQAGVIGRTTLLYFKGTDGLSSGPAINVDAPFDFRKGVNGLGLNAALTGLLSMECQIKAGLSTTMRYDFYQFKDGKDDNTIYVDQSLFLTKSFRKKYYVGLGFTIYNIGKELTFVNGGQEQSLRLQFNSIDFFIGVTVWKKFGIEPKLSLVQKDFPGTIKENATLLGARVYYEF